MKGKKLKVTEHTPIAMFVKDYPKYAVTTTGDVYSFAQNEPKILTPRKTTQNGKYLQVSLYNESSKRNDKGMKLPEQVYIHHLVYKTFVGEIPEGLEIDHIDCNPANNHLSNLRLITKQQNISRGRDKRWGYNVWDARDEMIKLYKGGMTQPEIAKLYGYSTASIWRVINNKKQRYKNGKYYYEEKN